MWELRCTCCGRISTEQLLVVAIIIWLLLLLQLLLRRALLLRATTTGRWAARTRPPYALASAVGLDRARMLVWWAIVEVMVCTRGVCCPNTRQNRQETARIAI